ncbi:MAG: hypothetical protein HZA09_05625 [Nitrospirae bacterium]|nr:hypothetical protein [Nitrospirota bacterium]
MKLKSSSEFIGTSLEESLEEKEREIAVLKEELRRIRERLRNGIVPVEEMLKRRGMVIFKKEVKDDTLVPSDAHEEGFYEKLKRYSFRLFLRDLIKYQHGFNVKDLIHYSTEEVTKEYLDYCIKCGIVIVLEEGGFSLSRVPIKSFGSTLEWFISKILEKEFVASTKWGVRFKDTVKGGDYDLIANIEGKILYMEIKSSPPKQIYDTEIRTFLDRIDEIYSDISIFFMDTELRMKDKIVPMFDIEFQNRYGMKRPEIQRMERELFSIQDRIFILNSKDNIVTNIGTALNWYFRKRD